MTVVLLLVLLVLLTPARGRAQAQTASSGAIRGEITDVTDARIAGASVTAIDVERGTVRETESDVQGVYSLPLLRPGAYNLTFSEDGFETQQISGIEVTVGETVTVLVRLMLGTATTEIEVVATPTELEPQRSRQATTIISSEIRALPINRRNFLDFSLLSPGVVETNNLADDQDFRVAQTPQSGLSFGGGNGRGNMFMMDGVEHYSNSGGIRPSISQSAVQEFQINRSSYSAEIGGGFGGAINFVTKSGTNEAHGEVFGFLRHRSLQARNYFDPEKSPYTREQSGASVGGPVKKNRSFFFGAFERLDRHETVFVPILQDRSSFLSLTESQNELVEFFSNSSVPELREVAVLMNQFLTPINNERVVGIFENNSGVFPSSGDVTMAMGRFDLTSNDKRSLFVRGSHARDFGINTGSGSLAGISRGRAVGLVDNTWMFGQTYIFSPRWVAETRMAYVWGDIDVAPNDPVGPELNVTGFGFFGRDIFLPSRTKEQHFQLRQDFIHLRGDQTLKFGVDINPVRDDVFSETFFGGRFAFGPDIPLDLLFASATGDPEFPQKMRLLLGLAGGENLIPNLSDPITALQGFAVDAPIFYQQGFGDPNWIGWSRRFGFYLQDSYNLHPKITFNLGMRYDLEANPSVIGTDTNNFGPRAGFAWSPDSKTVVRGGYGVYFSQINAQIANVAETLAGGQIAQIFVPLTGTPGLNNPETGLPLTSADIYQTLLDQGVIGNRTITAEDLTQFGLSSRPDLPGRVEFGIDDDFVSPYAQHASFEVQRALAGYTISAAYNFSRGAHITRTRDRNLFVSGERPDGAPTFGFHNPDLLQQNIFESTANSFYHAGTLSLAKRLRQNVTLNAHYTWSKAMDEVTDFNSDFQPHNQLDARAERSLSPFHQGHRFVATGIFQSPNYSDRGKNVWKNLAADSTLSTIVVASSFRPFNVLAGFDNLGDNHPTTHRPLGAGRYIGRGPDFFTLDLRLNRAFKMGAEGGVRMEVIGEVFNLLNRTNFRTVNNIAGAVKLEDLPQRLTGVRGPVTEPFSFTSAQDPRQFQLGLKILF